MLQETRIRPRFRGDRWRLTMVYGIVSLAFARLVQTRNCLVVWRWVLRQLDNSLGARSVHVDAMWGHPSRLKFPRLPNSADKTTHYTTNTANSQPRGCNITTNQDKYSTKPNSLARHQTSQVVGLDQEFTHRRLWGIMDEMTVDCRGLSWYE